VRAADPSGRLSALWGALLALVLPGLGQAYARRMRAAWGFALASVGLSAAVAALQWRSGRGALTPVELGWFAGLAALTLVLNLTAAVHAWHATRHGRDGAWPGWRRSAWTWAAALGVLAVLFEMVPPDPGWNAFSVPSGSMRPTLEVGDRFIALGGDAALAGIAPGDVIVFLLPRDHSTDYVKRLVATPGQTVEMRHGVPWIDGREVAHEDIGPGADPGTRRWRLTLPNGRSYVVLKATAGGALDDTPPTTLGPGQLFVMGDNLDNSLDSRVPSAVGPVPRELVVARAAVIFWSHDFNRIGTATR
jgi:signal peptidase I